MTQDSGNTGPKPPPVDRLSYLWRRIYDRKMVQWSVAYIAVAYAIQHGVVLTGEAFGWPETVLRVSMLLLILGLPVVVTFAWYHGERSNRHFSTAETTIVSILLVIGSILFYAFVQPQQQASASVTAARQAAGVQAGATPNGAVALAVLPFVNLSADKDQEFFSDGMTEEITSALAQVRGLKVIGRTSAFEFKGQNKDLRTIGQALGASHLIEGSVRKAGNRVRITAQLVKADDDTHLWAENYDRDLTDVFAIQEEIAKAIAVSLQVPLGLKEGQSLVANRTTNTDSYQDYLRARALVRGRGPAEPGGPLTEAIKLLEQVVARDPNYAPAWGLLGEAEEYIPTYSAALWNGSTDELRRFAAESLQKAGAAAQQAVRLDPNNGDAYSILANAQNYRGRFAQSEDLAKQALSLDPGNPEILHQVSIALANVGRLKDSLAMRRRLQAQEPLVPTFNVFTAGVLWENGQNDEAIAILKTTPPTNRSRVYLAQLYASMGRHGEAADTLRDIPSGFFLPGAVEEATRLQRSAPARAASPQTPVKLGILAYVYFYTGATDRLLDFYDGLVETGYPNLGGFPGLLWASTYAPLRKTEHFKSYLRKAGFVDYWRERGWPDLCHPVGTNDFACD